MTDVDDDLERRLVALSSLLAPADDVLVAHVMARVEGGPTHRRRSFPILAAAAIVLAAVAAAVLLVPASRDAVARWFGIGNTRIDTPVPGETSVLGDTSVPGAPASFPASLELGDPVTAAAAAVRTGIAMPTAGGLGEPSGIFVVQPPASGQIVVVYPPSDRVPPTPIPGIGALLSAAAGELNDGMYVKVAAMGTTVEYLTIRLASGDPVPAVFLSGEPHGYVFEGADGEGVFDTLRLATNTLVWSDGDVVHRLESALSRDDAVAIAATVTTG